MNRKNKVGLKLKQRKHKTSEKGIALVAAVSLIATISTLTVGFMASGLSEVQSAREFENRMVAFHLAEGGLDQTIVALKSNRSYGGLQSTSVSNPRIKGNYRTTVTRSRSNPNIFTIQANGNVTQNGSGLTLEQRNVTAIVEMGLASRFSHAVFANGKISMNGRKVTVDSYNSSNGPYQRAFAGAKGHIGTNRSERRSISLSGHVQIRGDASIGPNGDVTTGIVTRGSNIVIEGTRYAADTLRTLDPVTIPKGTKSATLRMNGNETVTLPSGTYYFKDLLISGNGRLNLGGPTTIYVSGDVRISGNGIGTAENLPTNLTINVARHHRVSLTGNANFYGAIYAPQSKIRVSGNVELFGAVVGKRVKASGNGTIHYDEALGNQGGGFTTNRMKSWQEL